MTDQHPITPPPELVQQWEAETAHTTKDETWHVATQAARWGADQELEACCHEVQKLYGVGRWLRSIRRPKPPSLKEQALAALQEAAYMADDIPPEGICSDQIDIIRRALNELPE